VQFFWDRLGKKDDNSSCWIRVSQPWAGKNWGAMWIPRISQEVIVSFLEGDPDRPIITGRVYNADNMPPYTLPDEQTKSTFKSYSSKGGSGFNEFRFEDKKGDEQIFMHAEKNLDIRVKNNEYETVSKDLHLIVEQDHFEHVKNDHHETIDRDYVQSLGRDHHLKISGKQAIAVDGTQSLKVTGDVAEQFNGNHSEQVSQALYLKAGMTVVIEAPIGITLKCGGNSVVVDPVGVTLTSSALITIMGSLVNINSGPGSPAGTGTPCSLVPPTSPKAAEEADKADPGEMAQLKAEQIQSQQGKYGSTPITPFNPSKQAASGEEKKPHWIEIKLVDTEGNPVPGEKYKITLPDGSTVAEGTLDGKGYARVDGIDPGTCKVTFPNLDQSVWKPK
jgi:type VI secretion system secreted protein VgrG